MKIFTLLLLLFVFSNTIGQNNEITYQLYDTYDEFREPTLKNRRLKHQDVQRLITKLGSNPKYTIQKLGESIEGRAINLVSIGKGEINVFLWSQMHGDEPTATQAIFDIINFFSSDKFEMEKKAILDNLKLHFLPLLNPDGAEQFKRRNALGIDINRDALRLQSPEGKILKRVRDSLDADFGFNLHDQSTYYNAERTPKPATISYLAPAYNYEKEINEVRADAMRVIVFMNRIIQKYAPGQVGRYNDDFEPRAFGDNIQKWGTSAILIESGGYKDDIEKQEIRKLNYVSILSAIYTIADGNYKDISLDDYENIPQNDRKLFDLKIEDVTYNLLGKDYILDIGINHVEVDNAMHSQFINVGKIIDQGDLSTYYGYNTFKASGYSIRPGKVYPKTMRSIEKMSKLIPHDLLKSGYTYVRVKRLSNNINNANKPIAIVKKNFKLPEFKVLVGENANFLLEKDNKVKYAVINGFLIDLEKL